MADYDPIGSNFKRVLNFCLTSILTSIETYYLEGSYRKEL